MNWEVNYIEDINDFFLEAGLNEDDLLKIQNRIKYVSQNPFRFSEHVLGMNIPNLRRIRLGDFRMFVYLDEIGQTIYCLAYLHRNHCYDKKELNEVATIVKNFLQNK